MLTTQITIDELAKQVLAPEVNLAFPEVDFAVQQIIENPNISTIDELAKELLKPQVENAIPEVDLEVKEMELGFEVKELRAFASAKGLSITIFLLAMGTLIANEIFLLLLKTSG